MHKFLKKYYISNYYTIFLTKQKILCNNQFGFREGHLRSLAITDVHNFFSQNCDQQKFTCAIFLNLKKAFDSVDHQILLTNLYKYAIRVMAFNLFDDYLKIDINISLLITQSLIQKR